MITGETLQMLKDMKLSGMAQELSDQLEDSTYTTLGFEERLGLMVTREWNQRQSRKLTRYVNKAQFAQPNATVEEIEYHTDRSLDKTQILRFASCNYINEGFHIILKGVAGNGKTYLACALGKAACRQFRKVRYVRMTELLETLKVAKGCGELQDVLAEYKRVDLLIIDEWLLRPLVPEEAYNMLEIMEQRCGQEPNKSIIFCTQYNPDGWYERLFSDPNIDSPISDSILDRIIHNAFDVLIEGKISMRERHGLKAKIREGKVKNV